MSFKIYLNDKISSYNHIPISNFSLYKISSEYKETVIFHEFEQDDHKKTYGKSLIIGGDSGYLGSIILAGQSALKTGSRYVEVLTTDEHKKSLAAFQNELITKNYDDLKELDFNAYKVIVCGPGFSGEAWSTKTYQLLSSEMKSNIFESFFIIDAGFLTLLSKHPFKYEKWILTPHHGEAAQLLDKSSSWIENNRLEASCLIQKKYSGIVILKGRDTIINTGKKIFICKHGGPYMGVAGMGDCLTGVLNSMISLHQKNLNHAIAFAVGLHSYAADVLFEERKHLGLLPSDVIVKMHKIINELFY